MNKRNIFPVFLCLYQFISAENIFTPEFIKKCNKVDLTGGYRYINYFEITEPHHASNLKFDFHFAIKANSDGHVLLSEVRYPLLASRVYEIVIGGGGNSFSEIRKLRMSRGVSSAITDDILSGDEYRGFWLKMTNDGKLSFGKEGEDVSLMDYTDPNPLKVKYFSFATWTRVVGSVLYDCKFENKTTDVAQESPKELTNREKLEKYLFSNYDSNILPVLNTSSSINIGFSTDVTNVNFDVTKSTLLTQGYIAMEWQDEKIKWNPVEYSNIKKLDYTKKKLWQPEIVVFGSLEKSDLSIIDKFTSVNPQGIVKFSAKFTAATHCAPGPKLVHWPKDEHDCILKFGVWAQHNMLRFYVKNDLNNSPMQYSNKDKFMASEWDLNKIEFMSGWTSTSPYVKIYQVNDDEEDDTIHNSINVHMNLKRKHEIHSRIFYSPMLLTVLLVLSTFCTSTSPINKTTILCIDLMLIFFIMTQIYEKLPMYSPHLPNIVLFYICILVGICFRIAIQVLLIFITTEPRPYSMPATIKGFLMHSQIISVLGVSNGNKKAAYDNLVQCDFNIETATDDEEIWNSLILAIDRILFVLYTIAFSTLFWIKF